MSTLRLVITILLLSVPCYAQERAKVAIGTDEVLQYQTPETPPSARWLPVIRNPRPAYDSATQYLDRTVTVADEQVVIDWIIRSYTQEQLDARAASEVEQQERITKETRLQNVISTLRGWADQAETTTVTSQNAVTVLQTVVNRSSTFYDNFADLLELQYGGP